MLQPDKLSATLRPAEMCTSLDKSVTTAPDASQHGSHVQSQASDESRRLAGGHLMHAPAFSVEHSNVHDDHEC